jgi:hypothetical protein
VLALAPELELRGLGRRVGIGRVVGWSRSGGLGSGMGMVWDEDLYGPFFSILLPTEDM